MSGSGLRRLFAWASEGSSSDPLRSRSAAESWLRALSTDSVTGRVHQIIAVLNEPRPEQAGVTREGLDARLVLDAAADRLSRILVRRYVAGCELGDSRASAAWTTAHDISQAFANVYRSWLDEVTTGAMERGFGDAVACAGTRYLHYRALERRLRALRHEQWIPGKWRDVYGAYDVVRRQGADRRAFGIGTRFWPTAETELVWALLFDMLSRGSFSVRQVEFATRYLRYWLKELRLADGGSPTAPWIDLRATGGLRRPAAPEDAPAGALYLELGPLIEKLRVRVAAHAERARAPGRAKAPARAATAAERLLSLLESGVGGQRARAPRVIAEATVRVVAGFDATLVNVAFTRTRSGQQNEVEMGYELRRPLTRFVELNWPPPGSVPAGGLAVVGQIRDQSDSGFKVALPVAEWGLRTVGELIGAQEADTSTWRIGVVRRLAKPRSDIIEAGVEIITAAPAWVRLSDLDGVESGRTLGVGMVDGAVYALFVPPGRLKQPAVLIPVAAYVEGRNLGMSTAHAVYRLRLAKIVEQGADWLLAAVDVLGKGSTSRADISPEDETSARAFAETDRADPASEAATT